VEELREIWHKILNKQQAQQQAMLEAMQ